MRLFCVGALLVPLILPLFTSVEGRIYSATAMLRNYAHLTPKYDRIKEANIACQDVIDSASELGSNVNRASSITYDLSFSGGDWDQEPGTHPLLPSLDDIGLNDSDVSNLSSSPLKLSWFRITNVNNVLQSKQTVSVNGALDLVITRNGFVPETKSSEPVTRFQMSNGRISLSVLFQGVYTESEENGGERVLCLLGSARLPARQSNSSHPWGDTRKHLSLWKDDQILLVLRYPMRFTLTQRAIQGEMRSLRVKTNLNYFDKVKILSQLTRQDYKFGSQTVLKACDPYPYSDNLLAGGIDIYKGRYFCSLFLAITRNGLFSVMPNWRCNGTDGFCSKLGPFVTDDKEIIGTHGGFKDVRLFTQYVRCHPNPNATNVSLVLKAFPGHHGDFDIQRRRSGLGNMTLAAEGVWKSSKGQLCMVGCLGMACDSRVCIYIPTTFSINQRSSLVGSISSINAKTPSYFPLTFQVPIHLGLVRRDYKSTSLRYKYSKIGLAGALLEKHESFSFGDVIKKSLLKFPRLQENEEYYSSVFVLAEDLTFHVPAVLDKSPSSMLQPVVSMRILSVGSIFRPYFPLKDLSFAQAGTPYLEKAEYTTKQLLVNVSAQLSIEGAPSSNFSSLSVEGLYDPLSGKMYLIGCRDVRASSKVLFESSDLEGGFDCSIEVVVSYPPVTAQWLLNPTVRISITSQRPEDDPFYFKPVTLQTRPITYQRQREVALSEREIEGVIWLLTLSVAVACILFQLFYITSGSDSVAYVSLVTLGIQAVGFSLPLIMDVDFLFQRKRTDSSTYELKNSSELFHATGSVVNLLVLTAFLLTLRLFQKVWKSRAKLLRQDPVRRVPNEKLVLLITSVIHIAGFVCAVFVQDPKFGPTHEVTKVSSILSMTKGEWMILLEKYMGAVQDLFLVPQVTGNLIWQIECKPLSKMYYIGISLVRLVPHVYSYHKASTLSPYVSGDYILINPDTAEFNSKFMDVFLPALTALLAVLVYVQQRWSYEKLSNALVIGRRCRLLPIHPKPYEKLPSESFEAELTSTRDQDA